MGLVRRGFVAVVGAAMLMGLAAAPVAAIPPSFYYNLYANDCKTGAPIQAGGAVFAIQHFPAAAVLPIAKGLVGWPGPFGLGDYNFIATLSAPGYRDGHWVFHGSSDQSTIETWTVCLHPDKTPFEQLVETTYSINGAFSTSITTGGVFQATFTASTSNCSDITVAIGLDGSIFTSDTLQPGDSTFNAWPPQAAGSHALTVDASSGCGTAAGSLVVTTSAPA
jgi:hypothetical protein